MRTQLVLLFFIIANTCIFAAEQNNVNAFLTAFSTMTIPKVQENFSQLSTNEQDVVMQEVRNDRYKILLEDIKKGEEIYLYECLKIDNITKRITNKDVDKLDNLTPGHLNAIHKIHTNQKPSENFFHLTINAEDLRLYAQADEHLQGHLKISHPYKFSLCPKYDEDNKYSQRPISCAEVEHSHCGIFIRYSNKITPIFLLKRVFSPFTTLTIAILLYNYLVAAPTLRGITLTQDPCALAEYARLKKHNDLIELLIKNNISGSENLIPHIIKEVPFECYSKKDSIIRMSIFLMNILLSGATSSTTVAKYRKAFVNRFMNGRMVEPSLKKDYIKETIFSALKGSLIGFLMSILLQNYLMNLSEEFSKDSIAYGSVILVITPLLLQALSVIIEEHTLNRLMLIEFEPNKTVSQSIDEFLNNPSIEIKQ